MLSDIRSMELSCIRIRFAKGQRVLEVGGGSGAQARELAHWGCNVTSVDLPGRFVPGDSQFPVVEYDGRTLPFPDQAFDLVYSSHVLEHVKDLEALLKELKRVLKPDGIAVHVLPSSTWRLWTSLAHYPFVLLYVFGLRARESDAMRIPGVADVARKRGLRYALARAIIAGPHGEFPNALVELIAFRKGRWTRMFGAAGFEVLALSPLRIFYTGYSIFPKLSGSARRMLSRILGSSSTAFVLRHTPT